MEEIKIVLSTDENYVGPTAVTIRSLVVNASPDRHYGIYVMHSGVSAPSQKKLESIGSSNVSVHCVDLKSMIGEVDGLRSAHLSQETLYRLYIPDLFVDKKILYMDVDMVVCDDVASLYDIDLTGYVMAAVHDVITVDILDHYSKFLNVEGRTFFNAGILVINCEEFKMQKIKERCVELLIEDAKRTRPVMTFMDQDALNCICDNNVKFFDMSWNFQPLTHNDNKERFIVSKDLRSEYENAMTNPKNIHFTGRRKPWVCPGIFLADRFFQYEREIDFHGEIEKLREKYVESLSKRFPYWNIEAGSKIAIYGLGDHGMKLKKEIEDSMYADIVVISDGKVVVDDECFCYPEELKNKAFDKIVITIENESIAKNVYEKLEGLGINKESIIWLFERKCPWK